MGADDSNALAKQASLVNGANDARGQPRNAAKSEHAVYRCLPPENSLQVLEFIGRRGAVPFKCVFDTLCLR